jgi:prepilin-type processing-associated H-X9-DG protein
MNLGDKEIAATADKILASSIVSPVSPSGTIQFCELHDARNLLGKPDLAALPGKEFVSLIFDGKKAPYHGTLKAPQVNVLFYDGHVEMLDETSARKGEVFRYKKP